MNPSASARQTEVWVGVGVGEPREGGKRPGRVRRRWAMMWSTTAWSVMKLKIRSRPGQVGQASGSTSNTRRSNFAQVSLRARAAGESSCGG